MRLTILILYVVAATLILAWASESVTADAGYVPPSIANITVPSGLHCTEDEAITWVGIDTLGCVHMDTLYLDLAMERGSVPGGDAFSTENANAGTPQPKLPETGYGP